MQSLSSAVLALVLSSALTAQGTFLELPNGAGSGYAVSADGSVVCGTGTNGVYRWTAAGGTQYLGISTGGITDMSADGTVISSSMQGSMTPSGLGEAAIWRQGVGWQALGGLATATSSCSGTESSAYGLSADGNVMVGLGWESCSGRAFQWDAQNGMVNLGALGPYSSRANCCNGDGSIVGGWDEAPNGSRRAAIWVNGVGSLMIPVSAANPTGAGETWGMNNAGTVIVGGETGGQAWRCINGRFESLGDVPGSQPGDTGTAHATNADGSMIVGTSGTPLTGFVPFAWTEEDGMMNFNDFLAHQKIDVPQGQQISWVFDITPDGYHIVGRRGPYIGAVAYRVELPAGVRYGVTLRGNNTMDLRGTGSTKIGDNLVVTTRNVRSPLVYTVIGFRSTRLPLLGGTLLVDLSLPHLVWAAQATGGTATFNFPMPNDPTLVGASLYMQSVDLGSPIYFSNAIKATIT